MRAFWLAFVMLLAGALAPAQAQQGRPSPRLEVTLHPMVTNGVVDRLGITLEFERLDIAAEQPVLQMPITIVGTPTAAYPAEAIDARDAHGRINLRAIDQPPTPSGVYRNYVADRAVEGRVTVRYVASAREIDEATRNGPLFDFRAQPGGAVAAGWYLFALPPGERVYDLRLSWELADLPRGARGIWSFGEGDVQQYGPAQFLVGTFFAMGEVRSEPATGQDTFGLYWLGEPPFDVRTLASQVHSLYTYMSTFFGHERPQNYRVFVRHNVHPGSGGTALQGSFMFGYSADDHDPDNMQRLIAHEMAHNWPRLNGDEPHALTAWYTEGMAEYYSLRLLLRSGVLPEQKFLELMNERAEGYYTNPYVRLTNEQAGEVFWSDSRAQRVPYGRGLMYLVSVDARLRAATNGARSLDDLVREVRRRQDAGETIGLEQWAAIVERELGASARSEFEAMQAGTLIVPPENSLGPCYHPVARQVRAFELGFDRMRLGVVNRLVADSAAASAGIREGDRIISYTPMSDVMNDETRPMELVIERDGERRTVSYLPRAQATEAWLWEPVTGNTAQCQL